MERDRPIKSTGRYNMNFVDWDSEGDAVINHMSSLASRGVSYEQRPYFDVPLSQVEFLTKNLYDCTSTGLSEKEISMLARVSGELKECTICLNSSRYGIKLLCGHVFHDECIRRWLRCRIDCPNCRQVTRN